MKLISFIRRKASVECLVKRKCSIVSFVRRIASVIGLIDVPLIDPPVYVSSSVGGDLAGNVIEIIFDKDLEGTGEPAIIDFIAIFSGGDVTVTSVVMDSGGDATHIILTLSRAIEFGETGTIVYIPGTTRIVGVNGFYVGAFSESVTNNVSGTVPVFVSAVLDATNRFNVVLTFDSSLAGQSFFITDFVFTYSDGAIGINNISVSTLTIDIEIDYVPQYGETLSLDYTPAEGSTVDAFDEAVDLSALHEQPTITNIEIGTVDNYSWVITFSENIETTMPNVSAFAISGFTFSGVSRTSANKATLVSNESAVNGATYTMTYTKPSTPDDTVLQGGYNNYILTDVNHAVTNNVASAYEAETTALLSRFTSEPSTALKDLINVTVKGLKDDGVWALGDCLYVRGVHDSQAATRNWIKNAHNSTLVNAPTFTAKQGFTGDGATSYINNNYSPANEGDKLSLTSMTISVMNLTIGSVNSKYLLGCGKNSGGNSFLFMLFKTAANEDMYMASTTVNGNLNITNGAYLGYTRTGVSVQGYLNGGVSGAAVNITSGAVLPSVSVAELAANFTSGLGVAPYNGQMSFSFYGGYLTPTQMLALYTRMAYFYANVGGTF